MKLRPGLLLAALGAAASPPGAAAQPAAADPAAFALVVGSNAGGTGQAPLRYAQDDASRMAEVLRDLGGYAADHIQLVLDPTRTQMVAALDLLTAHAVAEAGAGRQPRVFFYYSGHARSDALILGDDEFPLAELRERLVGLSGGLTVVVLDACQSGAFSRVKGAEPSADFSYNSLARLNATGVAVLASSSASELSQESDRLGASYFTHHLLVGLRGAGDASGDGEVSLDEAYRYAYHRTLVATAATAVGAQHVSLEVELRGKGEVAITYPAAADAQLELAAPLEGEVLIERRNARAVVAELHKARGAPVRLGLPAGGYRVLVRPPRADHLRRCDIDLARGAVGALAALDGCERVALSSEAVKHPRPWYQPSLAGEIGLGSVAAFHDGFNRTLEGFGYEDEADPVDRGHLSLSALAVFDPHFAVVTTLSTLGAGTYSRAGEIAPTEYSWGSLGLGLHARGSFPLPVLGGRIIPFVQAGGGPTLTLTHYTGATGGDDDEAVWGWHVGVSAGLAVQLGRHVALFAEWSYVTAPGLDNLVGDTHDTGGRFTAIGVRASIYRSTPP